MKKLQSGFVMKLRRHQHETTNKTNYIINLIIPTTKSKIFWYRKHEPMDNVDMDVFVKESYVYDVKNPSH